MAVRRERWLGDDAEDFAQWVRLQLLEHKDRWLGAYGGRSSMATYIAVIVTNLVRDYRNHKLGKWRPSAAARRAGKVGIRLDELLHRDRRGLDEAIEILRRNEGFALSATELRTLAGTLPPHYPRRFDDETPEDLASDDRADARLDRSERLEEAARADRALTESIDSLPPEDCLMLRLRYVEGFTIARIARRLGKRQRPLYRHFDALYDVLKTRLQAAGLTKQSVADILGSDSSFRALTRNTNPSRPRRPGPPDNPSSK